jgi:hypothetical protein
VPKGIYPHRSGYVRKLKSPEERYWGKVDKVDSGCWLWRGAVSSRGYGNFTVRRKQFGAHRYSYEMAHGPIPPGLIVCHTCDTPACVNPAHLFVGTDQDNVDDMMEKGRGNRNFKRPLTCECGDCPKCRDRERKRAKRASL